MTGLDHEWHRMTINRTTGPDCAVTCNLINTHTRRVCSEVFIVSIIDPPLEGSIRVAYND